ncbi:MAG: TlpA disulfide reductase family protein [Pirellulaceae bacterium]
MQSSVHTLWAFLFAATVVPAELVPAQELKQNFLASGVTRKVGGYSPQRAEMNQEEEIVKVAPEGLQAPKYGKIEIGDRSWAFILDEPEDGEARLFLDANADGDLTNDPEVKWQGKEQNNLTQYSGDGKIDLGDDRLGAINFYRFDPEDPRRKSLANTLMYYGDYGFEYSFELDGQEFSTFVAGLPSESTRLPIDRDGNGNISRNFEMTAVGKPFNFTGTTYVIRLKGDSLALEKADEEVEQLPLPPDLRIGKPALKFTATTMGGDKVLFPSSFEGKIVMLDFWATWCGPCIAEIPNMKTAYEKWHDQGFEILGVSFDREKMEEKIEEFLEERGMPWPQIYEGKMWDTEIGDMHDVSGIPFVLLVDGDSGEILATARELRGAGLSKFIGQQLKKKFGDKIVEEEEDAKEPEKKPQKDD